MTAAHIKISDIYRFKLVMDPQVSPADGRVAFVVETMSKKDKTYYKNLYLMDGNGKNRRQLTVGNKVDHTPR